MDTRLREFLKLIPEPAKEFAVSAAANPLREKLELAAEIENYVHRIDEVARRKHDLDVNLSEAIAQTCLTLLDEDWDRVGEIDKKLIQIGCCYFIDEGDAEGDLESVFGFDDDAELLNAVLDLIARPELKIIV